MGCVIGLSGGVWMLVRAVISGEETGGVNGTTNVGVVVSGTSRKADGSSIGSDTNAMGGSVCWVCSTIKARAIIRRTCAPVLRDNERYQPEFPPALESSKVKMR